MEIITKPRAFLNTITLIDLLFPKWDQKTAEEFGDSMKGKEIYIIDRKEITANTVRLIQVECNSRFP